MRSNSMSAFGRMSYTTHLAFYPATFAFYQLVIAPWRKSNADAAKKAEWDGMIKGRPVDPDIFNPFTQIPYHNNPELKYVFAHTNMKNYVNQNHINPNEYLWKNYHHSFDHNNQKQYTYNWTSV